MNAYLSAKRLGITENERHWLIEAVPVLWKLRPSEVVGIPDLTGGDDHKFMFDMQKIDSVISELPGDPHENNCGTAGCILGLCMLLARINGEYFVDDRTKRYTRKLRALFYPSFNDQSFEHRIYHDMTPRQAAIVVKRFLTANEVVFPKRPGS